MAVVNAKDVAEYILARLGPISAIKLQKLVYYGQAWSLVWDEVQLFEEPIQAWEHGPVVPALYRLHAGKYQVEPGSIGGDPERLDLTQRETLDAVLDYYGHRSPGWLVDLTHNEKPWKEARGDLDPEAASTAEITLAALAEYYASLPMP